MRSLPPCLKTAALISALFVSITAAQAAEPQLKPKKIGDLEGMEIQVDTSPEKNQPAKNNNVISEQEALENYYRYLELSRDGDNRAQTMRRLADLQLEQSEDADNPQGTTQPEIEVNTVAFYEQLLAENPGAPGNDRVWYQLARAHEQNGDLNKALEALNRLISEYPDSPARDEARFRRGEVLFSQARYAQAQQAYGELAGTNSRFSLKARYKLAWSLYKQGLMTAALDQFGGILNLYPDSYAADATEMTLASISQSDRPVVADSLRAMALACTRLDINQAPGPWLDKRYRNNWPGFAALLYDRSARLHLGKQRYTDAARTWEDHTRRQPGNALNAVFYQRAIEAYRVGGFPNEVLAAKGRFVEQFRQDSTQRDTVRSYVSDLAKYFHARAQQDNKDSDYTSAIGWYQLYVSEFADAPNAGEMRFLLAELLYERGRFDEAAGHYSKAAQGERGADAAYAALLSKQRANSTAALAEEALAFARQYPQHPESDRVLTKAAEDHFVAGKLDTAAAISREVIERNPDTRLQRSAWVIIASVTLQQQNWSETETAASRALALMTPEDSQYGDIQRGLDTARYKQAESLRSNQQPDAAADAFIQVADQSNDPDIAAKARYDAAALFLELEQWPRAITALEQFRQSHPQHPLNEDIPRQLALAYSKSGQTEKAAAEFARIGEQGNMSADVRREAAWQAASLLEQAGQKAQAKQALENYIKQYPQPFDRAIEARQKLADFAAAQGNGVRRDHWLEEIIKADAQAGNQRTDRSRTLAARAALKLAEPRLRDFRSIVLEPPLDKNLRNKKTAMEMALAAYARAADYDIARVTTEATYHTGRIYTELSQAMLDSERPANLSGEALDQYEILLEEQAFPFEEKSIEIHEANLQRGADGALDEWVRRSLQELALLDPGRYTKRELTDDDAITTASVGGEDERFTQAVELMQKRQYAQAEPLLTELISDKPKHAEANINLGMIYARTGREDEAIDSLRSGLKKDKKNWIAHNQLGVLLRKKGEHQTAETAYLAAIKANADYAPAHFNLAILYDEHLQQPTQALTHYQKYAASKPNDLRVKLWIAALQNSETANE